MPAENISDVTTFIEANKDSDEVKTFITGIITPERVNSYLDSDKGITILQPRYDSNFTKGLDTWKGKNLAGLVDEQVKKLNPADTPEQKRIRELENKQSATDKLLSKQTLKGTALKFAGKEKLPVDLVEFFIGDDETATNANLGKLKTHFDNAVDARVKEIFKKSGRPIPKGDEKKTNGMNEFIRSASGH